ncbi:hypothetical protein V8E55_000628 [Tylopilus felleus]
MRVPVLFACLALPLLSTAQSSQVSPLISNGSSQTTITSPASSASQSSSVSGSGSAAGSGSISGSASTAGNATTSASASATTTSNLPTAPSSVGGAGGDGPNGQAPSPGASAAGGIYGPPDGYIASAEALRSAGLLGLAGLVVGGALVLV